MNFNPRTDEAYQLLHDGILALSRMEQQGIRVDVDYIESKKAHLTRKIERLENQFKDSDFFKHWQKSVKGEINFYSNPQLSNYLYKIKKVKVFKETMSGQGSTDKETLTQLNIPELDDLLKIRNLKKLRDTYLESYLREQVNGYIHPFFNLHLVVTYRSSSSNPNLQNVPKRDEESMQICRGAIYPRPEHQLLEVDFKSIEVSINACYNKDSTLIKYVSNPKSDMHADMAKEIFALDEFQADSHYVLRQAAKNGFVFPEFYGDYYGNCAENMACGWGKLPQRRWKEGEGIELAGSYLSNHLISKGITSFNKFTNHVKKIEEDFWGNRFPEYAAWKERWWSIYKKYGYIDLLTGFRCQGVMSKNEVINTPAQGTAFHCLLWCIIEIDKIMLKERWDTKIISQVHDSVIFDVNPGELDHVVKVVRKICCEELRKAWKWIIVPLDVEMELSPVDKSWVEKEKINA